MKHPAVVIADAIRSNLHQPYRADEAAHGIIGALTAAGYEIVKRRGTGAVSVGGRGPRPTLVEGARKRVLVTNR